MPCRGSIGRTSGGGRNVRGSGRGLFGSFGGRRSEGGRGAGADTTSTGDIGGTQQVCPSQSSSLPSIQSDTTPSIQSNPLLGEPIGTQPSQAEMQPTNVQTSETEPEVGKKRKDPSTTRSTSVLWETFTKCKLPNSEVIDEDFCTCKICGTRVPCATKKNGTSSMWNHVWRNCPEHPLHPQGQPEPKQTRLNTENVSGGRPHKYSKKRCDERCLEMIIKDELPFRHVEKEGFRAFAKEMQPEWTPLNRKQIAQGVLDKFNFEKKLLLNGLKIGDNRISITTDTWTSIQTINYMVVTGHFLDSEWILHKRILCFCPIGSHKGDDIGRLLDHCLRQWEITKVFTITIDNASSNDVVVQYMKKKWRLQKSLMWDGDYVHLRCGCHIINLIIKDGLKELEYGISAIQNCAKYVRSSAARLAKFREYAVMENCGAGAKANVPLDVVTRWNIIYLMLEAALKYESVFSRMAEEDVQFMSYFEADHRVGPPSFDDWRNVEVFCVFLKKFYEATLRLSAWKSVTANVLFVEMIALQCEIDKACASDYLILRRVATSMKAKFEK